LTGDRADQARSAIESNPGWYHTIELAPGVITPGRVDLRAIASRVLPDDLSGKRVLDVGAFDGFWSFEMERRGADVVAIDVERLDAAQWPPLRRDHLRSRAQEMELSLGRGFKLSAEALGSNAERVICDVCDLSQEKIGGSVDFAFSGAILLHLRDPVLALERIRNVLQPDGELRLMEPISPVASALSPRRAVADFRAAESAFTWWLPNLATVSGWTCAAGFSDVRREAVVRPPQRPRRKTYVVMSCRS
jgi:tRNA (mo5U34)-methyltransferase